MGDEGVSQLVESFPEGVVVVDPARTEEYRHDRARLPTRRSADRRGAPGADADSLVTVGASLLAVRDWTFLLGPGVMAAINALSLGTLMYRSGPVPGAIPPHGTHRRPPAPLRQPRDDVRG
jgi:hypothetical protein